MKTFIKILLSVFATLVTLLFALSCSSMGDPAAGLSTGGTLTVCPESPNCVSSEEGEVAPLSFTGSPESAWETVRITIQQLGGNG